MYIYINSLIEALRAVQKFSSKDVFRPNLNSILIEFENRKIRTVATNAYALAIYEGIDNKLSLRSKLRYLITNEKLQSVITSLVVHKRIYNADPFCRFKSNKKQLIFFSDQSYIITAIDLMDIREFPNYKRAIKEYKKAEFEGDFITSFDCKYLRTISDCFNVLKKYVIKIEIKSKESVPSLWYYKDEEKSLHIYLMPVKI